MRNAFVAAVHELARRRREVMVLVGDNGAIVFDAYRRDCPEQFINVGIAEANLVGVSAGLAACGKAPFAYTIGTFLTMRACEQVRNDVCLQRLNVKLVGIGAGFVYSDLGPTHHATEDLALLRALPGLTVLSPADPAEARQATLAAAAIEGPVYLRLATGGTGRLYGDDYRFELGRAVTLRQGQDATIVATGAIVHEALAAAKLLEEEGVSAGVINVPTLKPFDGEAIAAAARQTGAVVTVEEHSVNGGLGSAVAEALSEAGGGARVQRLGLRDSFAQGYGSYAQMKRMNGLDAQSIAQAVGALRRGVAAGAGGGRAGE